MKRNKIFKSNLDLMTSVHEHYPNAKQVPVAMGNTVSNIYEDDTYTKQVAEVLYHYPGDGSAGMFGYNYNLIYLKN